MNVVIQFRKLIKIPKMVTESIVGKTQTFAGTLYMSNQTFNKYLDIVLVRPEDLLVWQHYIWPEFYLRDTAIATRGHLQTQTSCA